MVVVTQRCDNSTCFFLIILKKLGVNFLFRESPQMKETGRTNVPKMMVQGMPEMRVLGVPEMRILEVPEMRA